MGEGRFGFPERGVHQPGGLPWKALASFGGFGYSPFASGTVGTLPAVVIWWFAFPLLGGWGWLALSVVTTGISTLAAHKAGPLFGKTDAGEIVIDEVAGLFWTMTLAPHDWRWAVAGFFAFRLFDIVKPWPASYFDKKVKNGFGVTMDDVVAGLFACALLHAMAWIANAL
ncbi:MAG: phosphatidylglycerophosphatase A [Deltaproteobacteria bacterium]|nr:phosphatidylglycerophosphatase A [Deltaproteobacteria bacterium]